MTSPVVILGFAVALLLVAAATACPNGSWGPGCASRCSSNCKTGICDVFTGECTGCSNGYWGANCTARCSNACSSPVCEQQTGACSTCYSGYWGDSCNNTCNSHCSNQCNKQTGSCSCYSGFWGPTCNNTCNAHCSNQCDQNNGSCRCYSGFWGPTCNNTCGSHCSNQCDQNNGSCRCYSGFWGPTCDNNCNAHCSNQCDPNNGSCRCYSGFWGPTCNNTCSPHCSNQCDANNGSCRCYSGYAGPTCHRQCSSHCISNCNVDLTCSRCQDGWSGPTCSISENALDACSALFTKALNSTGTFYSSPAEYSMAFLKNCENLTATYGSSEPYALLGFASLSCTGASLKLLNLSLSFSNFSFAGQSFTKNLPNYCEAFINPLMTLESVNSSKIDPLPMDFSASAVKTITLSGLRVPMNIAYSKSSGFLYQSVSYDPYTTTNVYRNMASGSVFQFTSHAAGCVKSTGNPGQLTHRPFNMIMQNYFGLSLDSFTQTSYNVFVAPLGPQLSVVYTLQSGYVRVLIGDSNTRYFDLLVGPIMPVMNITIPC